MYKIKKFLTCASGDKFEKLSFCRGGNLVIINVSDFEKHELCLRGKIHPSYIPYSWNHVIAETKRVSPTMSTSYFRKYPCILQTHYRNVAHKYLTFEDNFKCSTDQSCPSTFAFLLKTQATYGDQIVNAYSSAKKKKTV